MLEISATSSTTMFSAFRLSASSRHSSASFFESISVRKSCSGLLKVKPRVANGFGYGGGNEAIYGFSGSDAFADLGGGNAKGKAVQGANAEAGGRCRRSLTGPGNGDKFGRSGEFIGRAPFVELRDVIGADEVEKFRF